MSFVLDERILEDGRIAKTVVGIVDGGLHVSDGAGRSATIPVAYLVTVLQRYGRALQDGLEPNGATLDLGDDGVLRALRFRAVVDADSRDYVVYEAPGGEPVAALGRDVAAALVHLARAAGALH